MAEQEDTRPEAARIAERLMKKDDPQPVGEPVDGVPEFGIPPEALEPVEEPVAKPKHKRRTLEQVAAEARELARAEMLEKLGLSEEQFDGLADRYFSLPEGSVTPPDVALDDIVKADLAAEFKAEMERTSTMRAVRMDEPQAWLARPLTVHEAILAVMQEVQSVGKGQVNDEYGFAFRGVDAMVNACGPAMRKHGLLMLPVKSELSYRDVDAASNGMREVTGTLTWKLIGPDGSSELVTAAGESLDFSDKGSAKAASVAWRVALIQTFVVPTGDRDPDADSHRRGAQRVQEPSRRRSGQSVAGEENQTADGRQAQAGEESQAPAAPTTPGGVAAKAILDLAATLGMDKDDVIQDFGQFTAGEEKHPGKATLEELETYLGSLVQRKAKADADAAEMAVIEAENRRIRDAELQAEAEERAHAKIRKANGEEVAGDE